MPLADEEPAWPHDADNAEDEDDNNNDDEDEDEDEEDEDKDEDEDDEDEEETATVACASAASSATLASSPSAKHLATSSASAATSSASASASVPGAAPVAARSSPAAASASTAASSSLLPIAAPPFQASSPPPASPAAPPSTSPSSLSARLAISPAVAATPLSPPQPNYDDDDKEEEDDDNGDNDGKTGSVADAQSRSMSSHSFALSAAHHGLAMGYPASTASPSVYVPAIPSGGHYASYATVTSPSQPMESYRASSAATSVSTLLPSMQTMDSMAQQVLGQASASLHHTMSMSMSASLAAVASPSSFYPHHSVALPSNYNVSNESMSRYPLPHDPRILGSRGGPKKEIKRRTKTGCLTCRKRRIKCDETHPTCNNCKKSKRDCLGYDPVFRQQAAGGSANSPIQPAPANQPTFSPSAPSPSSLNSASAPSSRAGNSYGSQPSMLPTAYASAPTAPLPSTSASHTTAGAIYSPPTSDARPIVKPDPSCVYQSAGLDPAAKHISSICSSDSPRLAEVKPLSLPDADSGVETMKVDEILNLLGPAPPQYGGHTEEGMNEIIKVYHEMYAGGLSLFFETSWYYFLEDGKMTFPKDINLIDHMASFLKVLEAVQANDHAQMTYSGILEMRIVWELACTVYQVPEHHHVNGNTPTLLPAENDGIEAKNRLRVVEALLNGDYLETNPFSAAVSGYDQSRTRQFDFWYCLAEFVRRRDDPDGQLSLLARETMLGRMRQLLDKLENRDLLYSIAVVRELAPRFEPTHANHVMHNADERDPRNRLAVAIKFIQDEAQVTGGMTNVVRRVSDIALRAFVTPGFNVARIN